MVDRHGKKRDLAVVMLLRHTGIRVGELCELRLSDVELSERKGSLTIRADSGGRLRTVPVNVDARRALASYLEIRPAVNSEALFVGQRGEGLRPHGVELVVAKYARLAGLEGVTPGTLRHSFATHALDSGVDLVTVAHLMGHQRMETTAIYISPHRRDLEQAAAKLEPGAGQTLTPGSESVR